MTPKIKKYSTQLPHPEMNRYTRRMLAKLSGVPMPAGVYHSSEPTHRVEYKEVIKKSRAGVKYTHYKKQTVRIIRSLKEQFFAK